MNRNKFIKFAAAALLSVGAMFGAAVPAQAAQADIDLLQSYVGTWSGNGVLKETNKPNDSISCKFDIDRGTDVKVTFQGRCTLSVGVMSMNGSLIYNPSTNRYSASMTTNSRFGGSAQGRRRGKSIDFDIQAVDTETGERANVDAKFALNNDKINVSFSLKLASGGRVSASVPMRKR